MAEDSKIEWTHHTHNIVWGCQRVSEGCTHCYAETLAKRYGYNVWGPAKTTERRTMSAHYWEQPLRWNDAARKAGERRRVFCGSMSDVFEDHPTNERERARLWPLIEAAPMLDWLLLTKRPENMTSMAPTSWAGGWPDNVWAMTSVENQEYADRRVPALLKVPARVRGLSCEPLLSGVILQGDGEYNNPTAMRSRSYLRGVTGDERINWVIVGGESGHGARPMHPDWARSLRDQCQAAGVAFHFKQWGEYRPVETEAEDHEFLDVLRGDMLRKSFRNRWIDQQGRVFYGPYSDMAHMFQVGKKAAGRLLDGREWSEYPELVEAPA